MSAFQKAIHPHKRGGTSQSARFPAELKNCYVQIDERKLTDLIAQTAELSRYFNYFELDSQNPSGSWKEFFAELYDFQNKKATINQIEELYEKAETKPHLALFITFLQLFSGSISHLNHLGEKHLMFFYEKMLQLKRKTGISPKVTLFGEISNKETEVFIPKNTKFKAGKNANGNNRYFFSDEDQILNLATVNEIKNINFLQSVITSRPVSNSADGIGGEFTREPKSWYAFGKNTDRPAEIGFCIASPLFLLNNGKREIWITKPQIDLADFDVMITVKSGWKNLSIQSGNPKKIFFEDGFPEVVGYKPELHGFGLKTTNPVIKFLIKGSSKSVFQKYRNTSAELGFTIVLSGIKELSLQNELGKIDAGKPFQPFGNQPKNGISELIIGHPFIFSKFLNPSKLKILKEDVENTSTSAIFYLENQTWAATKPKNYDPIFHKEYSISTKNNYIKIIYQGNYSRESYINSVISGIKTTQSGASFATTANIPKEKIPLWNNLSINAELKISSSDKEAFQVFHLHPFGEEFKENQGSLLPYYAEVSYLMIGLQNMKYGKSVSIHFQMQEGSGNQDLPHPNISWGVFCNNSLQLLSNVEIVKDTTLNLSQSGIIQFSLLQNRFVPNTFLNGNLVWLIAFCGEGFEAIPQLISIQSQAFTASYHFEDTELFENIDSETITKPENPIPGLKKIYQPYKSFGGRNNEDDTSFILRSSEHLRHKGVAISLFDYERILLQEFPSLFLVKCIPHTNQQSENAPGKVMIIVIPNLKKDNTQVELKPKVSLGEREKIKKYLQKITSPFIEIEVRNPTYKEIKVKINVAYLPKFAADKDYYNALLNEKIKSFISPWLLKIEKIEFNREGYLSSYINFIEELEFVDNITLFNLYVDGEQIANKIEAGSEDIIFTSAENHIITNNVLC